MNEAERQALVNYRLLRAVETMEEARLMQGAGHWNACANRLYYAAFYAVSALLLQGGFTATKHSGLKALFNQHYIKPGVVDMDSGRLYNRLFDLGQEGDYLDFVALVIPPPGCPAHPIDAVPAINLNMGDDDHRTE